MLGQVGNREQNEGSYGWMLGYSVMSTTELLSQGLQLVSPTSWLDSLCPAPSLTWDLSSEASPGQLSTCALRQVTGGWTQTSGASCQVKLNVLKQ